jgi:hypothetical protein
MGRAATALKSNPAHLVQNVRDYWLGVIVRDGMANHWRESYVCETGKSMKAAELAMP